MRLSKLFRFICVLTLSLAGGIAAHAQLNVDFSSSDTTNCGAQFITFTPNVTGGTQPYTYVWKANGQPFSGLTGRIFNTGYYTIDLIATDANGTTNTATKVQFIKIYQPPTVKFTVSQTSQGCPPVTATFTDQSTAAVGSTIVSWGWSSSGVFTSSAQNPMYTFQDGGNKTVFLQVTDDKGCTAFLQKNNAVTVASAPKADFSANVTSGCQTPLVVTFTNKTTPAGGNFNYQWSFGAGANPATFNGATPPSVTYNAQGKYTVKLIVTGPGCNDTLTRANYITIGGTSFSFTPSSGCAGTSVAFTDGTSGSPTNWTWNFNDPASGTNNISASQSPTHTYTTAGCYTPTLTVNVQGCILTATAPTCIQINAPPSAAFTVTGSKTLCGRGNAVSFQAPSGTGVTYGWNFGDPGSNASNSSAAQSPTHTFNSYGTFPVKLTVTDGNGCSASFTDTIKVKHAGALATASKAGGCAPVQIAFTNNSAAPAGFPAITSYQWNFGAGAVPATSNAQTPPTVTFPAGLFTVSLVVANSNGCHDTITIPIKAGNKPTGAFTAAPTTTCASTPVQFTNQSTPAPTDSWLWTFNYGVTPAQTSTTQNPTFVYTNYGQFSVRMIVGDRGCLDTITKTNYIDILPPVAKITTTQSCANRSQVAFSGATSVGANQWKWKFGVAGSTTDTSSLVNPVFTYPAAGSYTVTLTVTNNASGCTSTKTVAIKVISQSPTFTLDKQAGCIPLVVQATNTSTSTDLSQRTWYAPGSTTPSIVDGNFVVSHAFTYNTAGTYKVKLILRDQNYCLDSLESAPIVVSEVKPQFTMSFNPLTGCVPTTASFTDASTASPGTVQSLAWDFGDPTSGAANTSTIANPSHLYTLPGAYIIKLTAVSTAGCTLEKDTLIQTFGTPYNFTRDSIVCTNQDIQVAAQVSGSNSQYLWNFGDPASGAANTSTLATPIKTYTTEGSYMVCLDLTDPNGCTGHLCKTVTVANPHPAFIVDKPNGKCPPHNVKFTDQSTNAIKWLWDFGDGTSTSTQQNPLHSYFFPGSYAVKLKVTGAGGCSDSLTKTNYITVGGPTGSLAFSPNRGCKPLTVTFTATGNNTRDYIYDIGDVAHTTIIHNGNVTGTDVLNFIFNKDSIFHPVILLRDATGCTVGFAATDSIVVITTPAIASPKAHVAICIGDTVRLHGAGGVSYLWDNTSNTLSCTNCQNPVATPPVTMIYTVTVTGQNTCTATDTLTVKVLPFPHPTLTITPDSIICPGATIPLLVTSSTNPATYAWDVGGVGLSSYNIPNPNATPTVDSVRYNVTVTGAGQCTSVASVTLTTIHEKYEIGGPTRTICKGGSVTLKPLIGTSPVFTAVHSPQSVLSCASCDSTVASPTKTDTIAIVVTSPHYCRLKDSVLVRVVPHDSVFAGIDTFTCVGTPVRLNGFAPKDGTFFWTPTTYLTDYNTHNPYANPPAGQQFYSYAITWQKDLCKWVDTTRVELITKADITAKADTDQVCAGMPVKIRAKGRAYLFSWHPSAGLDDSHNAVATVLNPQTNLSFYVIGAISTCKTDTAYVNIAVNALPSVKAKPAQAYYFPNEIVPISVVAPTGLSYAWTPTTYLIGGANTATTSAQPTADITYTVTVTDINSCTNTANVSLRRRPECYEDQIVVPTGFTPNGDGQNDILYVLGDAVNLPSIESFRVYDRWGNAVFETNDKAHGWDGTYKGQPVSPGVFIFYVTAKCVVDGSIITKSGNVTLLR